MNKQVTEFFEQDFILTGDCADPRGIDFTLYTQKLTTLDPTRLPVREEFYMEYDSQSGQFTDLAVEVRYNYTLDGDGNVQRAIKDIRYFFTNGAIGTTRIIAEVYQ
jgi:hypothetical protein